MRNTKLIFSSSFVNLIEEEALFLIFLISKNASAIVVVDYNSKETNHSHCYFVDATLIVI